ncbi:sensor histidine kinase [Brachybacterium nesterenkovii]|uniref:sensor histidine kinase n=1 Tax=Brachybacterium nesterenkovii TaxID=47847 RepID=UPI00321A416E
MSTAAPAPPRPRFDPFRWVLEHPGIVDTVIFGAATFFLLVPGLLTWTFEPWWFFSLPMIAAGSLGRVRPGLCALIVGILAVLHFAVGQQVILGDAMIFYALYCTVAHARVAVARTALGAALFGALLQALAVGALAQTGVGDVPSRVAAFVTSGSVTFFVGVMVVMGTWAIGKYQHARIDQVRLARERAEQAEREREQRAALAVADERARIAREMHDVVAHSLSVIIAQADGGRFIASQDPAKAVAVLETIGTTGRSALADMRSLLGVLRHDEESSFGPQPDLTALPELLDRVRATGLRVDAHVTGDLGGLPQATGLSLFRLVQEALTNVLKHAGEHASAAVRVQRDDAGILVEILDDGQGIDPSSDGQGHGLTGMRERIGLLGGTLLAGPLPAGGFRVSARVPLAGSAGAAAPRPAGQITAPEPAAPVPAATETAAPVPAAPVPAAPEHADQDRAFDPRALPAPASPQPAPQPSPSSDPASRL